MALGAVLAVQAAPRSSLAGIVQAGGGDLLRMVRTEWRMPLPRRLYTAAGAAALAPMSYQPAR
jgi:hypothetical protein